MKTNVVLRISSNRVSNSNDNTNFPHELLLTNRQVANICKAFANHSSIDIKLSKTQLSKMIQSGGFLGNLLGKLAGPLMISLVISNDEMDDILKIVKSLEDFGLLLKGVSETIQHEAKEQRGGFLSMLLGTLGTSLLVDILSKGLSGKGVIRAGEGTIRAFHKKSLTLPPHPLTNFEIQEYYQNEPRFNGVFSRDNLCNTIKNGAYLINLDEYHDIGTHWVALYVNNKIVTYFDSFGVEHIPKEIMKFIVRTSFGLGSRCKKIITNIYRIQAYNSIMCGYFCIGFINFMFNGKSLTDYTNLFSPNDFNKNDDIILQYFGLYDVK